MDTMIKYCYETMWFLMGDEVCISLSGLLMRLE